VIGFLSMTTGRGPSIAMPHSNLARPKQSTTPIFIPNTLPSTINLNPNPHYIHLLEW
jgi:mannitol/fructose-specific phosphotransferase system IIA component (Ntr-type)